MSSSLRNTRKTLEYLDGSEISRDVVRVVANRYGQPQEVPVAKAEEALGRKIAQLIPDEPKTVNRAGNYGVPVLVQSPTAKVSAPTAATANRAPAFSGTEVTSAGRPAEEFAGTRNAKEFQVSVAWVAPTSGVRIDQPTRTDSPEDSVSELAKVTTNLNPVTRAACPARTLPVSGVLFQVPGTGSKELLADSPPAL